VKAKRPNWKYSLSVSLFKICAVLLLASFGASDEWSTTLQCAFLALFVPAFALYTYYYDEELRKCK